MQCPRLKERVELYYLLSPSGPLWPVLGWTLPLTLSTLSIRRHCASFFRTEFYILRGSNFHEHPATVFVFPQTNNPHGISLNKLPVTPSKKSPAFHKGRNFITVFRILLTIPNLSQMNPVYIPAPYHISLWYICDAIPFNHKTNHIIPLSRQSQAGNVNFRLQQRKG